MNQGTNEQTNDVFVRVLVSEQIQTFNLYLQSQHHYIGKP